MPAVEGKGKGRGACELCGAAARVYCDADEARLCWGCDALVHGANFLVARHVRALLCRGCTAPTPWRAAGPRLGLTASLCDRCFFRRPVQGDVVMAEEEDDEDDEEMEDDDDEEEEEEGEGENQVVPWAAEAESTPPPVASSTSSSSRGSVAADGPNAAECEKDEVPYLTSHRSLCRHSSAHHVARTTGPFAPATMPASSLPGGGRDRPLISSGRERHSRPSR